MFGKMVFIVLVFFVGVVEAGRLQDMIDEASAGSTLKIYDGVYRESLKIHKDLKLVGKSVEGVIISPSVFPDSCAIAIQKNVKVFIEGITVDLSGSQQTVSGTDGIRAYNSDLNFKNFHIKGASGNGLSMSNCKSVIEDCQFNSNGIHGIEAIGGDLKVKGCTFSKNKASGIYGSTENNVKVTKRDYFEYEFSDNIFVENKNGIYLMGYCRGKSFHNNIINNESCGIYANCISGRNDIVENSVLKCDYAIAYQLSNNEEKVKSVITKNQCLESNRGIYVKGENSIADIIKNECNNNKVSGITIEEKAQVNISENTCNENGGQGIYLFSLFEYLNVEGNVCNGNKLNGIYITGGGGNVEKNICNNNTFNGINVNCCDVDITQNECTGNNNSGIHLDRNVDGSVRKNLLKDNQHYGIVRTATVLPEIEKNDIRGNAGLRSERQ